MVVYLFFRVFFLLYCGLWDKSCARSMNRCEKNFDFGVSESSWLKTPRLMWEKPTKTVGRKTGHAWSQHHTHPDFWFVCRRAISQNFHQCYSTTTNNHAFFSPTQRSPGWTGRKLALKPFSLDTPSSKLKGFQCIPRPDVVRYVIPFVCSRSALGLFPVRRVRNTSAGRHLEGILNLSIY